MWYQFFKHVLFRPMVRFLLRPKFEGGANVPRTGAAVLAANHIGAADTYCLPALIDRTLIFPAKKELFEGRTISGRIVAWFLTRVGMVPLDRSGGRASAGVLGSIEEVLARGSLVGIFPEGTRSPDGRMYRGHTGVARLALTSGAPVVPVAMISTQVMRRRIGLPTMRNARIVIGEPVDYSPWRGQEEDSRVLRWVTDDVMARIQELSGQDYVDVYASRVKRGNLRGADLSRYLKPAPTTGVERPPSDAQLGGEQR
ncbi:1-acyl-sn-glycerol-3-phosphate acyltransferase [Propionibacterium cyclohexanicum]|uniref:1-acyl-sn-glycerol-3-phosphate acyltransferase n=1 Tax=Propionibacterium cyclohexanicum TaxID=64702 RepID=A0A1H9PJF1_9ACTN|nr:lysophospholipid acyltransferase family protein [Propionibacterium cyclohexanicum]SER47959.1 1-acyl-sn-glycerol-3-phosphate acyltransferase [Propionibacterium cyclohexanicum]